jgi:hypothetical protein
MQRVYMLMAAQQPNDPPYGLLLAVGWEVDAYLSSILR